MSGSKRKGRASPDVEELDDDVRGSTDRGRRIDKDRETSERRRRSISFTEEIPNEERDSMRFRSGASRPGGGGYRHHAGEVRPCGDYDGRYSPGFYHPGGSSSRGPHWRMTSPETYGATRESRGWSESREPWPRARGGRYEDYPPPAYGEDYYGTHYDVQDSRIGGRPMQRRSPPPEGSSRRGVKTETQMEAPTKRPIQLDRFGAPVGQMADVLKKDIAAFARELNPLLQWESQSDDARKRLESRIYADYHCYGEASRISDKYLKREVGTSIRTHRFHLRKLIDERKPKPPELREDFWEKLVDDRGTKAAQEKSTTMKSIAKNRGLRNSTRKRVEQATTVQLTTELGREPYQSEVLEAMEKELAILAEKSSGRKGKKEVKGSSASTYEQDMAEMQRRLDAYQDFIKKWEPKMKKWDSYFQEQEQVEDDSSSEGSEGEAPAEANVKKAVNTKRAKQMSGEEDSENSSSQSGSDESNSNTGSESAAEDEEGTVKPIVASKPVQRPESSNAGKAQKDTVPKPTQKSTKDVSEKELNVGEQRKSLENTSKLVGKNASTSVHNEQSVKTTTKVAETKVAETAATKEVQQGNRINTRNSDKTAVTATVGKAGNQTDSVAKQKKGATKVPKSGEAPEGKGVSEKGIESNVNRKNRK